MQKTSKNLHLSLVTSILL